MFPPDSLLQGPKRPRKGPEKEAEDEEVEDEPGLGEYESAAQECITFYLGMLNGTAFISIACSSLFHRCFHVYSSFFYPPVPSQEDMKLAEEGQNASLNFPPEFTHQIFGEDEIIHGYKELQVLNFARTSLS